MLAVVGHVQQLVRHPKPGWSAMVGFLAAKPSDMWSRRRAVDSFAFADWRDRVIVPQRAIRYLHPVIQTIQEVFMPDATLTSSADVLDFLTGQHEQIKSLFSKTLDNAGPDREQAFMELRRLLAVHEAVEEEIVHPRAKRKLANLMTASSRPG